MRKAATVKNTQVSLSGKTPMQVVMEKKTKRSHGPSFHESRTTDIHTNKSGPSQWGDSKVGDEDTSLRSNSEMTDIRRDLAERTEFVPPDLRVGQQVLNWQEDPTKFHQGTTSGKWLTVEILAVKGPMVVISTGASIFQVNASKLRRSLDSVDLVELPDSCERTGAPVLWLSSEGQTDVWELCSDDSYLSAILDRQGLMVAAPIDLRTKKAESFSPQALQGCWSKIKRKNPKIVVMSPTVFYHMHQPERSHMASAPSVFGHSRISTPRWWNISLL